MTRWLKTVMVAMPFSLLAACSSDGGGNGGTNDAGAGDSGTAIDAMVTPDTGPRCSTPGEQCLPPVPSGPERTVDQIGQEEGQPPGDLTIVAARMMSSVEIQTRTFAANSCEVQEGCTLAGRRRLLRFDLQTPNVGQGRIYLGPPTRAGRAGAQFEWGACHRHYHFIGYADYRLYDEMGQEVGVGHKQSFCLEDSGRQPGAATVPADQLLNCSNQGITNGYFDMYSRGLDCQYVDITGLRPGRYFLRARINTDHAIVESDYTNNVATVPVMVPEDTSGTPPPASPLDSCANGERGLDRDCGWEVQGSYRCEPNTEVTVGCDASCNPPIGAFCGGNPVMRICNGDLPCTAENAIAANDDSGCGTSTCSRVTFTCPMYGRYTVLTGGYEAGQPYTCIAAASPVFGQN